MAFMRYRALPQGEVTAEEFWAWLGQFDADHDGPISQDELQGALWSLDLCHFEKIMHALNKKDKNKRLTAVVPATRSPRAIDGGDRNMVTHMFAMQAGGVRAADANRDGAVGGEEAGRLFAYAQKQLGGKITQLGSY
ncbi:hypothetical protein VPH35_136057 [Triticum aestivum]